jgi:hypothetical protein
MKNLILAFALLSLVACADRKYVSADGGNGGQGAEQKATCTPFKVSGLCASFAWKKFPQGKEFGEMIVKIWRPNAADGSMIPQDVQGAVAVELFMPDMGHGSSPVQVERQDVGTFSATRVYFTMSGDWVIKVEIKEGNVIRDEADIPITI